MGSNERNLKQDIWEWCLSKMDINWALKMNLNPGEAEIDKFTTTTVNSFF